MAIYKYDYMCAIMVCSKIKKFTGVALHMLELRGQLSGNLSVFAMRAFYCYLLLLLRFAVPQALRSAQFGWWITAYRATTT